jgi:hypothetical protein
MFISFFFKLRAYGIKVSIREYLALLEALRQGLAQDLDALYLLSRSLLVKQEGQYDAFDIVFGQCFRNVPGTDAGELLGSVDPEWLKSELARHLSPEDLETIESMGGLEALLERFRQLLEEQDTRHEGGTQQIGAGGASPFGADGDHPEGIRPGGEAALGQALKVWERRQYANLSDQAELNTRNLKLVLKSLRLLTREGLPDELDLGATLRATADNAGMLDLRMRPARRNRVRVLLLLDAGGSMDPYIERCSQLFTAARHEFKHLETYYFHNCLYESVWRDNRRRFAERTSTWEILHSYPADYRVIFVGDASMSPIEILYANGSVEHNNAEPGLTWLERISAQFEHLAWINPTPVAHWRFYPSIELIRTWSGSRMFPMTVEGLRLSMRCLRDGKARWNPAD